MPDGFFGFVQQHMLLLSTAGVAAALVFGSRRAKALVAAGLVSDDEVSRFTRSVFTLMAVAAFGGWLLQRIAGTSSATCLLKFPPTEPTGVGMWLIQAAVSGVVVWWLWARNGSDLLARIAPAFSSGPALGRRFSPARVRLAVTAFVVIAPLGTIVMQLAQPSLLAGCASS